MQTLFFICFSLLAHLLITRAISLASSSPGLVFTNEIVKENRKGKDFLNMHCIYVDFKPLYLFSHFDSRRHTKNKKHARDTKSKRGFSNKSSALLLIIEAFRHVIISALHDKVIKKFQLNVFIFFLMMMTTKKIKFPLNEIKMNVFTTYF